MITLIKTWIGMIGNGRENSAAEGASPPAETTLRWLLLWSRAHTSPHCSGTKRSPPPTVTPTLIETTVLKYPHGSHNHTFSLCLLLTKVTTKTLIFPPKVLTFKFWSSHLSHCLWKWNEGGWSTSTKRRRQEIFWMPLKRWVRIEVLTSWFFSKKKKCLYNLHSNVCVINIQTFSIP